MDASNTPYVIGENYFIRTVTYHFTGKLKAVYENEIVITDAAWIADSGRFQQAIEEGSYVEVEPYPDGREVIINRGSITDAVTITHPLPRKQQ